MMTHYSQRVDVPTAATKSAASRSESAQQAHLSAAGLMPQASRGQLPPAPGGPAGIREIQRTAGNQVVLRMLDARRPGHPLAGPVTTIQALRDSKLDDDVQRAAAALHVPSDDAIRSAATEGVRTPATSFPFLNRIQASFGRHSITHIQAHIGPKATRASRAMNALAYASGDHVVFGTTPDLRTAAHEAAHIVQQQAGVQLAGGIGRTDDPYERHADAVADAVVAGRCAGALLELFAPPDVDGQPDAPPSSLSPGAGMERAATRGAARPHRAGSPAFPGTLQCKFEKKDTTEHGTDTYDVGLGSLVVIVDTVYKDGRVFYHKVKEVSPNPLLNGRISFYLVDTDQLLRTRPDLPDVENTLPEFVERPDDTLDRISDVPVPMAGFAGTLQSDDEARKQQITLLPKGLPNVNNNCFINAILQLMAGSYAPYFNPEYRLLTNAGQREVQCGVWEIIQRINNVNALTISEDKMEQLRQTMRNNYLVGSLDQQEDAAELMRRLLEVVLPEDASVGVRIKRSITASQAIGQDQLGNDPAEYVGGKRSQEEAINMIEVDVEQYNSLKAFLQAYLHTGVTIDLGPSEVLKVRNDGVAVEVSRTTEHRTFTRLPELVTFYLKRFTVSATGAQRLFDESFPMPSTLPLSDEAGQEGRYEMVGVVVHTGGLGGGHYYSHVKRGQWATINDLKVSSIDALDVDQRQGYLYTYRRVRVHDALEFGRESAEEPSHEPQPRVPEEALPDSNNDSESHEITCGGVGPLIRAAAGQVQDSLELLEEDQIARATIELPAMRISTPYPDEARRQLTLQLENLNRLTAKQWLVNVLLNRMKTTDQQISTSHGKKPGKVLAKTIYRKLKDNHDLARLLMRQLRIRILLLAGKLKPNENKRREVAVELLNAVDDALKAEEVYLEFRHQKGVKALATLQQAKVAGGIGRQAGPGDEQEFRKAHRRGIELLASRPDRRELKSNAILHNPDQCAGGPYPILWNADQKDRLRSAQKSFKKKSKELGHARRRLQYADETTNVPGMSEAAIKSYQTNRIKTLQDEVNRCTPEYDRAKHDYLEELVTHVGNSSVNSSIGRAWMGGGASGDPNRVAIMLEEMLKPLPDRLETTLMNVRMEIEAVDSGREVEGVEAQNEEMKEADVDMPEAAPSPIMETRESAHGRSGGKSDRRIAGAKEKMRTQQETLDDLAYRLRRRVKTGNDKTAMTEDESIRYRDESEINKKFERVKFSEQGTAGYIRAVLTGAGVPAERVQSLGNTVCHRLEQIGLQHPEQMIDAGGIVAAMVHSAIHPQLGTRTLQIEIVMSDPRLGFTQVATNRGQVPVILLYDRGRGQKRFELLRVRQRSQDATDAQKVRRSGSLPDMDQPRKQRKLDTPIQVNLEQTRLTEEWLSEGCGNVVEAIESLRPEFLSAVWDRFSRLTDTDPGQRDERGSQELAATFLEFAGDVVRSVENTQIEELLAEADDVPSIVNLPTETLLQFWEAFSEMGFTGLDSEGEHSNPASALEFVEFVEDVIQNVGSEELKVLLGYGSNQNDVAGST